MIVRKENIISRKDFVIKLDVMKTQSLSIKDDTKKLTSKVEEYREVAKYLATMSKHEEVYRKYEKCSLSIKKEFYCKHEGDILSYEHALNKLKHLNVDNKTPLDEIIRIAKEFKIKADILP